MTSHNTPTPIPCDCVTGWHYATRVALVVGIIAAVLLVLVVFP